MTIRFSCPHCQQALRVRDELAGKRIRCPQCAKPAAVPLAETPVETDDFTIPEEMPLPSEPTAVTSNDDDEFPDLSEFTRPTRDQTGEDDEDGLPTLRPIARRRKSAVPREDSTGGFVRSFDPDGRSATVSRKKTVEASPPPVILNRANPVWSLGPHWAVLLLFIPLVVMIVLPPVGLGERLLEHPEVLAKLETVNDADELCALFPDNRLPGAHLARQTWVHWVYAAIALFGYWALLSFSWRESTASPMRLLMTGIITGTIGIILLLAFQFVAFGTQGFWLRGRGIVVLLFLIVKFIGYSYICALDPESSLFGSLLGFTCGVGFCEEFCKAFPIIYYLRDGEKTNWQGACLVGLASGIGFGVSEGIQYSADFYNGMSPGLIYLVRFLSCVGLHAVWSSGVALLMFANQDYLDEILSWEVFPMFLYEYLLVPMFLHGLYDTLLKKNMDVWALVVALGSFVWWLRVIGKIGTPKPRRRRKSAV